MLTDKDIQKLIEVFATRDEMDRRFEEVAKKEDINKLHASLDKYAGQVETLYQEFLMLVNKVNRMEKWIKEVSEKVGIKYQD